jgi:hypothetical protein
MATNSMLYGIELGDWHWMFAQLSWTTLSKVSPSRQFQAMFLMLWTDRKFG